MRCTSPRKVGFKADGKTLSWSPRTHNKQFATFELPCGKCIECRLSYARQWAVRCVHEAQMHEDNSFITLTYSDENLKSPKLIYEDFQKFMKRLRKTKNEPIGMFVTGEYGEKNKRPHWHAIIFNWRPTDCVLKYTNHRGDKVYSSKTLEKLWTNGISELGSVTIESAGYCARYAAKKLVHGNDGHDFKPISKKSSKNAIGKSWLERYWPDVFSYGTLTLRDGNSTPIPRYYLKWFQKNKPDEWTKFVHTTRTRLIEEAQRKSEQENREYLEYLHSRKVSDPNPLTPNQVRRKINKEKFNRLQNHLKL